ncbi:hypothetical protein ARMSODRAFT_1012848 [Armillaria solidipes]|uniref:Uncharacterized protein n=1 Tax=Armillaria solidipes TaxID=1076256 RepID=A0A2H3CAM9_9AGAR|nr:hypothetical protein ARMSODRAFT_1012848 [Armillaria solidipes]
MAPTTSGTNSPMLTEKSLDPTTPRPGSYEDVTSKLASISGATTGLQWDGTSQWRGESQSQEEGETRPLWPEYSLIETERYTFLHPDIYYRAPDGDIQNRNNETWTEPYSSSPPDSDEWMNRPLNFDQFNNFHYDYGTFGELDEVAPWTQWVDSNVPYPFPLPDMPPIQVRQHGQYHGPRHSRIYAGQGDAEGSKPAPAKTIEELRATREDVELKLCKIEELQKELNDAKMAHRDHASQWGLPLFPGDKGKAPDRGRPPIPNDRRPLYERTDRYSIPCLSLKWKKPDPIP